jgi:hypothetical protein
MKPIFILNLLAVLRGVGLGGRRRRQLCIDGKGVREIQTEEMGF